MLVRMRGRGSRGGSRLRAKVRRIAAKPAHGRSYRHGRGAQREPRHDGQRGLDVSRRKIQIAAWARGDPGVANAGIEKHRASLIPAALDRMPDRTRNAHESLVLCLSPHAPACWWSSPASVGENRPRFAPAAVSLLSTGAGGERLRAPLGCRNHCCCFPYASQRVRAYSGRRVSAWNCWSRRADSNRRPADYEEA
jgi:hypothetical protein